MNSEPKDSNLSELKHYILAIWYKNANDLTEFQKEKQMIRIKEYLDKFDNQ